MFTYVYVLCMKRMYIIFLHSYVDIYIFIYVYMYMYAYHSHMHEGVHIQLGNEWHVSFFLFHSPLCVCVYVCSSV